jgi:hypothetical protein
MYNALHRQATGRGKTGGGALAIAAEWSTLGAEQRGEEKTMKLTVEEVAKLTKLSVATVRLHAANKKLGIREGNRRYFSRQDVETIKGSSRSAGGKQPASGRKPAGRKPAAKKNAARKAAVKKNAAPAPVQQPKTRQAASAAPAQKPAKRSFWSLFRPQPKQKISLLDAQVRK